MQVITIYPDGENNVPQMNDSHVLHVYDCIHEDDLKRILVRHGTPRYIVNDSFSFLQGNFSSPFYCVNLWLADQVKSFIGLESNDLYQTKHCANFIVNKKLAHRHLCIKMVELFGLDVAYTWNGIDPNFNLLPIFENLSRYGYAGCISEQEKHVLMQPINLQPRWIDYERQITSDFAVLNYGDKSLGDNVWTWKNGLDDIFQSSAVSIITESVDTQMGMHFSEKTLYSVLGLTFPIWVGGYKQAEEWRKFGFDTFDDIIDHDYQHFQNFFERCWYAIKLNLNLITDLERLSEIRYKHRHRLLKNRDLILNGQVEKYNYKIIQTWPSDLRDLLPTILENMTRKNLASLVQR